jgi:uncharacterized membrane protein
MIVGTYNMIFISGILLASRKWAEADLRSGLVAFGLMGIVSYLLFYHGMSVSARNSYLTGAFSGTGFFFHYALLAGAILVSILSLTIFREMDEFNRKTGNLYGWFFVFLFVFMASAELDHLVVTVGYSDPESISTLLTQNHKIGYPILWGITSFLLIAAGMKWKKRHLRIISLTLFLITLVKLFTVDIVGISEGGKIAAFISLGLLLLVVSFMYQRLKRLLLKDETENPEKS